MPRIMREHLRDKCSGGIGRDAATGSSKGAVLFFSGRMQGDEREDSGSGIRRHLPPEAVRTGEFGDTCLRTQPAPGIRRMTECRKPVRMDRYEATGPSVRAGTGGTASARQLPGERSGGASGRRRKPYDRQLRVSGGESANAPAEGATAGTVPPFVLRDRNTLSTARADNTSSRNESRPFRNPPRRGGMPAAGVAYRGAACAGLLPESGDFVEQTFFDAVK